MKKIEHDCQGPERPLCRCRPPIRRVGPLTWVLLCLPLLLQVASGPARAAAATDEEPARGVVRAEIEATISSELVAQISALPFKPGEAFRKGDVLVGFDCRRYEAELRAAKAEARASAITVQQDRHLLKRGAAGANDLAIAEAKLARAEAEADALEVRLAQCLIKAPFDGRVSDRPVDLFERPGANQPLLTIVKDGNLEIDLIVPSSWVVWLARDTPFTFSIDETGTRHQARIERIGAVVDPISRTLRVTGRLIGEAGVIRPGMSGSAIFQKDKTGHGRE